MDLALVRTEFRPDGIFSEFRDASGDELFVTIEHAYEDALGAWLPKLPDGVYTCQRRMSPKFGYELFEIMNVPDCTFIEIHIGNRNVDSSGCVCVGSQIGEIDDQQAVLGSKMAFKKFMDYQTGFDEFQLTVKSS